MPIDHLAGIRASIRHYLDSAKLSREREASETKRADSLRGRSGGKAGKAKYHGALMGAADHAATARRMDKAAAEAKKKLPPGYIMVFGKLRKINPKAARTGIAKLKR